MQKEKDPGYVTPYHDLETHGEAIQSHLFIRTDPLCFPIISKKLKKDLLHTPPSDFTPYLKKNNPIAKKLIHFLHPY